TSFRRTRVRRLGEGGMYIVFGRQNYGKVDVVPKLFYVATRFFHLYYVPLIPLGSYLVLAGTESGEAFSGRQIPLRWKSVLAGWVRAVLILCIIAGAVTGLIAAAEGIAGQRGKELSLAVVPFCLCLVSALGFWLTKVTSRASYHRAHELGQILGLE